MIEIKNLSKSFEESLIINGLDLCVNKGETLVIIGGSGCGKSVLLKHIVGLLQPDEGTVIVDGKDLSKITVTELNKLRLKIGMLFQGAALFDSLTVGENVGFSLIEHTKMKHSEILKTVKEKLMMVGLNDVENHKPSELSGGMQKRVGLARAICNDPMIILYDEPTTGLDPIMADVINDLIITLQDKLNVTSIVVTHDLTSAYKVADRIAMMYKGKIIGSGTPKEIKNTTDPIISQFINGNAIGPITKDLTIPKMRTRKKRKRF